MPERSNKAKRPGIAKRILWSISIALVILAAVIFTVTRTPEKMTDHATFFTPWRRQSETLNPSDKQSGYIPDHHWMPNGQLLRANFTLPFVGKHGSNISNMLERVAPKTGAVLSTTPLALQSIQRSTLYDLPLSPDGKRLILEDSGNYALIDMETGVARTLRRDGYGTNNLLILAQMQNSNIVYGESMKPGTPRNAAPVQVEFLSLADRVAWMPDSRSFLEVTRQARNGYCLQIRSLDDRITDSISLSGYSGRTAPKLLGVTHQGEALLIDLSGFYAGNLLLVNLKNHHVSSASIKSLPQGLLIKQVELSPDGKRLLWKTVNVDPAGSAVVGLAINQMIHRDLRFRVSVQVTDLDGGDAREICAEMMSGKEEDDFQTVHWMPDSKHISFWYKDAIYTIPAGNPPP